MHQCIYLMYCVVRFDGDDPHRTRSKSIFAMSISDILFSSAHLLFPFMSPKENPDALFAIGSFKSCEAIGFVHMVGVSGLVLYTVFLTYYFLKRIKYKITPRDFAQKEEKYFHAYSSPFPLALRL